MLPFQKVVLLFTLFSSLTLVGCSSGGSSDSGSSDTSAGINEGDTAPAAGDNPGSAEGGIPDPSLVVRDEPAPVPAPAPAPVPAPSAVPSIGSDPAPIVDADSAPIPDVDTNQAEVVDDSVALEKIGEIQLVDGESLTEFLRIEDGTELDLSELINTFNFTVTLTESEPVGSVAVSVSGCATVDRVENFPPYTVGVQGQDFPEIQPGDCVITATTYSLPDGLGEAGGTVAVNFSVVGESPATVAAVVDNAAFYEVLLNWDAPTTRSDGSALTTNDLASYQIRSASVRDGEEGLFSIGDVEATSFLLSDLSAGVYEFRIAAIDVNGTASGFSETLVVSVGD